MLTIAPTGGSTGTTSGIMNQVWRFNIDFTKVSDAKYFTDLDSKYGSTTDSYATQKFSFGYVNETRMLF